MVKNALSFDLEEWYHAEAIRTSHVSFQKTEQAAQATTPLLELLQRYDVHATFFTVGEVAQANPRLIAQIITDGHELAFHGWTHKPLWVLSREEFAAECEQFLGWCDTNFRGVNILGFRAPTFSLDHRTAWAVDVLREHGFAYDSSIFPAKTPLYGVPTAPRSPYRIASDDLTVSNEAGLLEVPMSVFSLPLVKIGFTGGLYFRALPLPIVKAMFQQVNRVGRSAVMFIHPWETYAPTPRLNLSRWSRFILYTGLPAFAKLERLLNTFEFDTMQAIFLSEDHEQ